MELQDLSDQHRLILCRFLRGQKGVKARGAVTIDPPSLARGLPPAYRGGVRNAVDELYSMGFLARKPKGDDHVFSLRYQLAADREAIVNQLQNDEALCVRGPLSFSLGPTIEPDGVDPTLVADLRATIEKDSGLELLSLTASTMDDYQDETSGQVFKEAALRVGVTCPVRKMCFEREFECGVLSRWQLKVERCPVCGFEHTYRGPTLLTK